MSQEFYETDPLSRTSSAATRSRCVRGMGPVSTALLGMSSGRIPWGEPNTTRAYAELFDRTAGMVVICEDLPESHNRVTLDPDLTDANGIPAPKIDYRLSENSSKMLEHSRRPRGRRCWKAAGAKRPSRRPAARTAGWHLMGTARMGTDPDPLGGQRMGPLSRRAQPVHRRRQHLRDRRRREPDPHDPGPGPLHRGYDQEEPRETCLIDWLTTRHMA